MTALPTGFPYRHATRLVNAFQFEVGTANLRALDHDFAAALLFQMIYRQALRAPTERRVSINGIATSLKQSTETMRRAAYNLVERGICQPLDRGIERASNFFDQALVKQAAGQIEATLLTLIADYRAAGFRLPGDLDGQSHAARVEAAFDIQLSVLELDETRNTNPASLHVIGTVVVLNATTLKTDTALGLRYGHEDTVPPDHLRVPASVPQVVGATGLSKTTVWRHLTAAAKMDVLRRVNGGYLLGQRYMDDPTTNRRSREKINYVQRVLEDLGNGRYAH